MACQRTSAASSRSRPQADRALGGALLFGYFLLGKQEKVTRAQGCAWKTQGCGSVVAKSAKKNWIPAFAGMTKWEAFPGMRRTGEVNAKTETHPHPTLPLLGRAKEDQLAVSMRR